MKTPYYLQFINPCKSTKKYHLLIIYQVDNIYYVINPRYDSFFPTKHPATIPSKI